MSLKRRHRVTGIKFLMTIRKNYETQLFTFDIYTHTQPPTHPLTCMRAIVRGFMELATVQVHCIVPNVRSALYP